MRNDIQELIDAIDKVVDKLDNDKKLKVARSHLQAAQILLEDYLATNVVLDEDDIAANKADEENDERRLRERGDYE